mmetsp:Transcript_23681/g.23436  ORF Transcript_23681/g.23436 Transcript_23681/m.23436 type:complete len:114 (-) Transcript_23681:442-783(-)
MNTGSSLSDSPSTRTSTPGPDTQILDVISNREEIKQFLSSYTLSPETFYNITRSDEKIIRDILMEPVLSDTIMIRIQEKVEEYQSLQQIEQAKISMSAKIKERIESLQRRLNE